MSLIGTHRCASPCFGKRDEILALQIAICQLQAGGQIEDCRWQVDQSASHCLDSADSADSIDTIESYCDPLEATQYYSLKRILRFKSSNRRITIWLIDIIIGSAMEIDSLKRTMFTVRRLSIENWLLTQTVFFFEKSNEIFLKRSPYSVCVARFLVFSVCDQPLILIKQISHQFVL